MKSDIITDRSGEYVLTFTTVDSEEAGNRIAEKIVRAKAAACVNIIPGVKSVYWWKGKVETASESILVIKSFSGGLDTLYSLISAEHPYDVPEIITVDIAAGSKIYLDWIGSSVDIMPD